MNKKMADVSLTPGLPAPPPPLRWYAYLCKKKGSKATQKKKGSKATQEKRREKKKSRKMKRTAGRKEPGRAKLELEYKCIGLVKKKNDNEVFNNL